MTTLFLIGILAFVMVAVLLAERPEAMKRDTCEKLGMLLTLGRTMRRTLRSNSEF